MFSTALNKLHSQLFDPKSPFHIAFLYSLPSEMYLWFHEQWAFTCCYLSAFGEFFARHDAFSSLLHLPIFLNPLHQPKAALVTSDLSSCPIPKILWHFFDPYWSLLRVPNTSNKIVCVSKPITFWGLFHQLLFKSCSSVYTYGMSHLYLKRLTIHRSGLKISTDHLKNIKQLLDSWRTFFPMKINVMSGVGGTRQWGGLAR